MTIDSIYQYNFPTTIRFGPGASKEIGDYLIKCKLSHPLLVTDTTVAQLDFFKVILADLQKKNIATEVFDEIHRNPVKSDVYKGTAVYDATDRDSVIGIGGGAALDVARAIVLRINHREDLFKYDDLVGGEVFVTNDVPHFITIPTTAGTGSEVGRSAIIADDETHQKKILFSPRLLATPDPEARCSGEGREPPLPPNISPNSSPKKSLKGFSCISGPAETCFGLIRVFMCTTAGAALVAAFSKSTTGPPAVVPSAKRVFLKIEVDSGEEDASCCCC